MTSRKTKYTVSQPAPEKQQSNEQAARKEFGRRLQQLHLARGWSQSDLARAVGVGRDSISGYVRGLKSPEPKNLLKLAEALKVQPSDLYPGALTGSIGDPSRPVLEMKLDDKDPTMAWIRVNQRMTVEQAMECITGIASTMKGKPVPLPSHSKTK